MFFLGIYVDGFFLFVYYFNYVSFLYKTKMNISAKGN